MASMIKNKKAQGFTLVELAVVVVIIGVLAAFAVPRFLKSVERSKAAEAFNYLSSVNSAQERYHARNGIYADEVDDLDVKMPTPEYFTVGTFAVPTGETDFETGWELTLTRTGSSAGYGNYTVTFDHNGYNAGESNISNDISPLQSSS